jgi:hypothetical protein
MTRLRSILFDLAALVIFLIGMGSFVILVAKAI